VDRVGFEPTISPMPRAYPTRLDDRPIFNQNITSDLH
jgi:hypothetical protein